MLRKKDYPSCPAFRRFGVWYEKSFRLRIFCGELFRRARQASCLSYKSVCAFESVSIGKSAIFSAKVARMSI